MNKVGIIMGSDSDLPVMKSCAEFFDRIGVDYEIDIVSAHRTPDKMYEYAKSAKKRGLAVIIAGAGGAAHLPGMVASLTSVPVVGVPVRTASLSGVDSLYSIVQMPGGIPVATVAINAGLNAAILAAEILAVSDNGLYAKLEDYKKDLKETVESKSEALQEKGYLKYLES